MQPPFTDARPENVVLVDSPGDLTIPDPTSAELVPVTSLVKKDVSGQQPELLSFLRRHPDARHASQVQFPALDICNSKVRHFRNFRIRLFLLILRYSTDNFRKVSKTPPFPLNRKGRQGAIIRARWRWEQGGLATLGSGVAQGNVGYASVEVRSTLRRVIHERHSRIQAGEVTL